MSQTEIIGWFNSLCDEGSYAKALTITQLIKNQKLATTAYRLCIKREKASMLKGVRT